MFSEIPLRGEIFKDAPPKVRQGGHDAPNALGNSGASPQKEKLLTHHYAPKLLTKALLRDDVRIKVESPSTMANLGPGFDILAVAVNAYKDVVEVKVAPGSGEVRIASEGYSVPSGEGNAAYGVVNALRNYLDLSGIDVSIRILKGVPPSMGLGSSGATSAGVAYAVTKALGVSLSASDLVRLAGEGERWIAGAPHYDNVAASLLGGFVLVDLPTLTPVKLVDDVGIWFSIISFEGNPLEEKTKRARSVLPKELGLRVFSMQASTVALLIHALHRRDPTLIGRAMSVDFIAEPHRGKLIPHYRSLKELALKEGALGFQISGAGPSVFSVHASREDAVRVGGVLMDYLRGEGVQARNVAARPVPEGVRELGG
ncbi:MAG: homoserine kinase [Desulfurococcales archaeon]|nr:homoserine kinase [Desulfurococcales archaeon]